MGIRSEKCLVIDIDGTLCPIRDAANDYSELLPYQSMITRIRELRAEGFRIILMSSRNMRTYDGNLGEITANTVRPLLDWLDRHDIPYDEVHMGKPWAGHVGFYVDDRAVRPDEFLRHDIAELEEIVRQARARLAEK